VRVSILICVCDTGTAEFIERELSGLRIFECAGCFFNDSQALKRINRVRPEIVILDTCFGLKSGFDMVKKINYSPSIIFVSGKEELAADAYRAGASDYLLKPVEKNRLALALLRTYAEAVNVIYGSINLSLKKIMCRKGNVFYPVDMDKISYVTICGSRADVHTGHDCYRCAVRAGAVKELLTLDGFIEIKKNFILSLKAVSNIVRNSRDSYQVNLRDENKSISISEAGMENISRRLNVF